MSVSCRLLAAACALLGAIQTGAQEIQPSQPWTVRDSVALRYFTTNFQEPENLGYPRPDRPPARFSPDGSRFFLMSWAGDPDRDQNVYTLWIYSSESVRRALAQKTPRQAPLRRLQMRGGFASYTEA